MATFTATSEQQLRDFLLTAAAGDTIIINNTNGISIGSELPEINKNLTIRSSGNTVLRGSGASRIFRVTGGNVVFENLTIQGGVAQGATNTGAPGLGGGMLITGSAAVTIINVNFIDNQAIGGSGANGGGSAGGTGGDGLGGAVYVDGGASLRISNSAFRNNSTRSGAGGGGLPVGAGGKADGGAIYLNQGSIITEGAPAYEGNKAGGSPSTTGGQVASIQNTPPPATTLIKRVDGTPTANDSVAYSVIFSEAVTGVDASDFVIVPISGTIGATIDPTRFSGSGTTYTVVVNTGNSDGTFQIELNDDDTIRNAAGVPLGGTGLDNGDFTGERYTVDKRPPTATITRQNNAAQTTAADSVVFTVQFSDPIRGIDTEASGGFSDFVVVAAGGVSGAQVTAVTPINPGDNNTAYNVTVASGSGNGTLALQLIDRDTILKRSTGVPLGGVGVGNGNVTSPIYTLNKTPPSVAAITLLDNSPTGDPTVRFRLTFDQDVRGVTPDDFVVAGSGITGASVVSITPIDTNSGGSARTFELVINTGSGDGSLGLNVVDNDSIRNDLNVPLGGTGAGNGNVTGPIYTVIKSAPLVASITPSGLNPTAAGTVEFTVVFNQDVTGVDRSDFRMFGSGIVNFGIASEVTGSGNTYKVVGNTGTGNGQLGLNLLDNDSIKNNVGAPLGGAGVGNGNFTGQTYTVNKTPPRVVDILRLAASPTNAATVNYRVTFSEGVTNVDPSDFTLVTQGITGAGITAVTRDNNDFYTVTVSTGSGDGTIELDLIDNDSIVNSRGLPLQGAGVNNGNFRGEVYNIDRTAPVANLLDVNPDPRRSQVDAITIQFSEAVQGFDLADLQLTRKGEAISLSTATLSTADNITWTLGNLRKLTNREGGYSLLLPASGSGIVDVAGNPLSLNASEQWTNQVNVEVSSPGITLQGTKGNNTLRGTSDSDTLTGLAGNDRLIGFEDRDRLKGNQGNDRLDGGLDRDTLIGGSGADRFIYSGGSQAAALENSLAYAPDRIRDFKVLEGDRIQLDFDNNLSSKNRPKALFNAKSVKGSSLERATANAFKDRDADRRGNQRLKAREAVFFDWRGGSYLAVNNGSKGYSANQDLVVNVSGIQFGSGDQDRSSLTVSQYFI
ncbi:MAG: hypothetical protein KME07_15095 [Pegethrix bostrychoides GSE-TBD4-15B]|jgi:hypothetical protein|uniref:Uncharacterized protein n=1 Tax=Pegethrix bostrychoides GSE-TBD4-15B TaxID=2839662 RepID=A0A951PE55_9CYAN|nr:hypothetical protein [Pegethrix bostrychoides GSE-TBD4-15B]